MPTSTDYDPARARMAFTMVSALFNGQVPPVGTNISGITALAKVQIAWQARLNGPLSQMAGLAGFGWHPVAAAEIEACGFIESLISLLFSKLVPPQELSDDVLASHSAQVKQFLADVGFDPKDGVGHEETGKE
jgi:hypothetical protein